MVSFAFVLSFVALASVFSRSVRNRLRALSCMSSRLRWSEEQKAVIQTALARKMPSPVFGLILLTARSLYRRYDPHQ